MVQLPSTREQYAAQLGSNGTFSELNTYTEQEENDGDGLGLTELILISAGIALGGIIIGLLFAAACHFM